MLVQNNAIFLQTHWSHRDLQAYRLFTVLQQAKGMQVLQELGLSGTSKYRYSVLMIRLILTHDDTDFVGCMHLLFCG